MFQYVSAKWVREHGFVKAELELAEEGPGRHHTNNAYKNLKA